MPCNCGSGKKYQAVRPDGSYQNYGSRIEADADVSRNGGNVVVLS